MQNLIRKAWQDYIINWASLTGVFFFNQPVSRRWLERGDMQQGVSIWTPKQGDCGSVQDPRHLRSFLLFHFRAYWWRKVSGSMIWMLCLQQQKQKCVFQSQREGFSTPADCENCYYLSQRRSAFTCVQSFVCLCVCWLVGLWAGLHILISTKPGWGIGLGLECISPSPVFRCRSR